MSFADLGRGGGGGGGGPGRGGMAGTFGSGGHLDPVIGDSYQRGAPPTSPTGYDQLHARVTSAVFDMNAAVHAQSKMVASLGTRSDTHDLRERLLHSQEATREAARAVSEDLSRLNTMANAAPTSASSSSVTGGSGPSAKARRAQLAKVHREFKGVLGKFEQVTRESGRKMRESVARAKEEMRHGSGPAGGGGKGGSNGMGIGGGIGGGGGGVAYDPAEEERQGLLERSRRQQLLQSENEIAFNESVIAEREEGIREVEATVGELAEIFKDIAVLVNEQGQMIDDIDANVGNAAARTEAAVDQLKSANKYQKRSRNKMCMIMIFLLLVGLGLAFIFTKGFK